MRKIIHCIFSEYSQREQIIESPSSDKGTSNPIESPSSDKGTSNPPLAQLGHFGTSLRSI